MKEPINLPIIRFTANEIKPGDRVSVLLINEVGINNQQSINTTILTIAI